MADPTSVPSALWASLSGLGVEALWGSLSPAQAPGRGMGTFRVQHGAETPRTGQGGKGLATSQHHPRLGVSSTGSRATPMLWDTPKAPG